MQVTEATESLFARHPDYAENPESQDRLWRELTAGPLSDLSVPFEEHWRLYQQVFGGRQLERDGPPRAWVPDEATVAASNLGMLMSQRGTTEYGDVHQWSARHRAEFWGDAINRLRIPFAQEPESILELDAGVTDPRWLPGARMNIVDACFTAPADRVAIVEGREEGALRRVTYGELEAMVNAVASGLMAHGYAAGDTVALYMPMNVACVAAYLGIVRAGCAVVSIADSFAPKEVASRLRLGKARGIITVDAFVRGSKRVGLYDKVREADAPQAVVIPLDPQRPPELRAGDLLWGQFLGPEQAAENGVGDPYRVTNVLFSSGTTGDPKAIPWTHLTPLKCAVDGYYHQDIHSDDVVAWPTNIGWMMGPWLIYASLINRATMALFEGVPTSPAFLHFVKEAGITVLGLVPAIVRAWRESGAVAGDELAGVRVFSSTGEASNPYDYLWLMSRTRYRAPVIEYCGGTEIGGGHLTGTVVQPASPATFTTAALGSDFVILDENDHPVVEGEMGEIFLVPPSIGLSQWLLNRDHDEEYYDGCPRGPGGEVLRRHGDEVSLLPGGFYQAHGRADDTMNLGGIKVSSIELERVMNGHDAVSETAAIAVPPEGGGADQLVVYVVPRDPGVAAPELDLDALRKELQARIKEHLNPLYRIQDVVAIDALPRTASNKVMRRQLRAQYRA